jgi:hypothetical protein
MLLKSLTIAAALIVTAASTVSFTQSAQAQQNGAGGGRGGGGGSGGGPNGAGGGDGSFPLDIVPRVPSSYAYVPGANRQPPLIVLRGRPVAPRSCANGMTPLGYFDCAQQ